MYKFASNAKLIDNKEVEAFGFDSLISQYKSDGKRESGRAKSLTVDVISRTNRTTGPADHAFGFLVGMSE